MPLHGDLNFKNESLLKNFENLIEYKKLTRVIRNFHPTTTASIIKSKLNFSL